jgi:hypothetical protein
MWALVAVAGTLLVWLAGMFAAFWLWGFGWGALSSMLLTALFWKQIMMVVVVVVAAIVFSKFDGLKGLVGA